jgi:hypothetical protein
MTGLPPLAGPILRSSRLLGWMAPAMAVTLFSIGSPKAAEIDFGALTLTGFAGCSLHAGGEGFVCAMG